MAHSESSIPVFAGMLLVFAPLAFCASDETLYMNIGVRDLRPLVRLYRLAIR